ncbi:hypothetical protein KCU98_g8244, partial [Aureobasidium melanogenum]
METDQNKMSKDSIAHAHKPIDFTVRSQNGLGQLKRFPREIRNIIYSSIIPQLMVHGPEQTTIDSCIVRELVNAPILATSKQLCVEFLEVFIRDVNLEESDEYHENSSDLSSSCLEDLRPEKGHRCEHERYPDSLEKLLGFVEARIGRAFTRKGVGLKINTLYFHADMVKFVGDCVAEELSGLTQRLQRLWDVHESCRIPSDQFYINIDYCEPDWWFRMGIPHKQRFKSLPYGFWNHKFEKFSATVILSDEKASIEAFGGMRTKLRDQLTAYKALKLCEFQNIYPSEDDYLVMDKLLNSILYNFYREHPIPAVLDFHIEMGKTAIEFWKVKEEQYSVWHLFDLAESWLEVKNE